VSFFRKLFFEKEERFQTEINGFQGFQVLNSFKKMLLLLLGSIWSHL